eukprot:TRINITY_DN427_c3_g1_i1.p1 TRINITY_DN427_c3_g1~~TRINITY_DN427_c3_g1_i1.p1  ORF type:complete len:185 (+),score=49.82 TRINITY_DN427_c3_g1_i1:49-555(+)
MTVTEETVPVVPEARLGKNGKKLRKRRPGKKKRSATVQSCVAGVLLIAMLGKCPRDVCDMLREADAECVMEKLITTQGTMAFTQELLAHLSRGAVDPFAAADMLLKIYGSETCDPMCIVNLAYFKVLLLKGLKSAPSPPPPFVTFISHLMSHGFLGVPNPVALPAGRG